MCRNSRTYRYVSGHHHRSAPRQPPKPPAVSLSLSLSLCLSLSVSTRLGFGLLVFWLYGRDTPPAAATRPSGTMEIDKRQALGRRAPFFSVRLGNHWKWLRLTCTAG